MPLLLLMTFLLHNAEEAASYPTYRETVQALVQSHLPATFRAPSVASFHIALVLVSLVAVGAMAWAGTHGDSRFARLQVRLLAWIMLINVALPHAPAAVAMGGYSPGLATALALNLPIATIVLLRSRRKAPTESSIGAALD